MALGAMDILHAAQCSNSHFVLSRYLRLLNIMSFIPAYLYIYIAGPNEFDKRMFIHYFKIVSLLPLESCTYRGRNSLLHDYDFA